MDINKIKKVLIIRLSALGDVAMSIPIVYSVCRAYPQIEFTMLTSPHASNLFIEKPANLVIISEQIRGRHSGIKGLYTLYWELRNSSFNIIADLHDVLRSKILRFLFALSGCKVAHINKGRKEKRKLTTREHKQKKQLKSSFVRYTEVFNKLGFSFNETFISLFQNTAIPPLPDDINISDNSKSLIGIAPFAKHKGKIYPIELMEIVVSQLSSSNKYQIFFFGSKGHEETIINEWANKYSNTISFAGKNLGFETELSIMSQLDVMLSMDSANMHLASLVNTPVISIWGATHPYAGFMGWRQDKSNTVEIELPCRPCSIFGNKPCWRKDYACLYKITPEMIIEKIKLLINSKK